MTPAAPSLDTTDASQRGAPVRVLVIDNELVHARTVSEGLERLGYRCIVAGSGIEGARRLSEEIFDVVVTDLMMNDIGGLEILMLAKKPVPRLR